MNTHTTISTYLAKPRSAAPNVRWASFAAPRLEPRHVAQRAPARIIVGRGVAALLAWVMVVGSLQYLTTAHHLPGTNSVAAIAGSTGAGSAPAQLARAGSHAKVLAVGPTGQMLPPIAIATTGTFSNRYGWGQCTKYVAGRRQVPGNWGNANTWYPRAAAAGWSVGTTPTVGAIAWTSAGPLGHVALVEAISADYERVYISEMNELGLGRRSYRWVKASSFKYIYAPGY